MVPVKSTLCRRRNKSLSSPLARSLQGGGVRKGGKGCAKWGAIRRRRLEDRGSDDSETEDSDGPMMEGSENSGSGGSDTNNSKGDEQGGERSRKKRKRKKGNISSSILEGKRQKYDNGKTWDGRGRERHDKHARSSPDKSTEGQKENSFMPSKSVGVQGKQPGRYGVL